MLVDDKQAREKIERFSHWCAVSHGHDMVPSKVGLWVRHADYSREVESLSAQVAELQECLALGIEDAGSDMEDFSKMRLRAEAAEAQVAELKKDAERMEYLDKNMRVLRAGADGVRHYIDVPLADSLRLAIDAAAKESGVSP